MVFTPTPHILILSGILSALFSTMIFHLGKSQIEDIVLSLNDNDFKPTVADLNTVEEPTEFNKLLDAVFVSHGMEAETVETQETQEHENSSLEIKEEPNIGDSKENDTVENEITAAVALDSQNFNNVYDGDWLILANFPWLKSGQKFQDHFKTVFPEILSKHSNIKLATLDCHAEPLLAAILQVRQYPSLLLVTDSGRLREWPLTSNHMNAEIFRFLVHREWNHIPVYQRLSHGPAHLFALKSIQIEIFNNVYGFLIQKEELMFDWIQSHKNLARGIVFGLLAPLIALARK